MCFEVPFFLEVLALSFPAAKEKKQTVQSKHQGVPQKTKLEKPICSRFEEVREISALDFHQENAVFAVTSIPSNIPGAKQ